VASGGNGRTLELAVIEASWVSSRVTSGRCCCWSRVPWSRGKRCSSIERETGPEAAAL